MTEKIEEHLLEILNLMSMNFNWEAHQLYPGNNDWVSLTSCVWFPVTSPPLLYLWDSVSFNAFNCRGAQLERNCYDDGNVLYIYVQYSCQQSLWPMDPWNQNGKESTRHGNWEVILNIGQRKSKELMGDKCLL